MSFRKRSDAELVQLGDEELIEHLVAARRLGELEDARTALSIFAYRRFDDLVRRALIRVPGRADAEDVAGQTLRSVLKAAFEGSSVGEAVSLINRVLERRIADYHRGRRLTHSLDAPGNGDSHGSVVASADETSAVHLRDVIERCLERFSETHRTVIELYVFDGYSAQETAEQVSMPSGDANPGMSEQNVHQIASRFRRALRDDLEAT